MDKLEMQKLTGNICLSLAQVMQMINANAKGILFITDNEDRLAGCITDGDIRRFLLAGGKLDAKAIDAANKNPKMAGTLEEAMSLYKKDQYVVIPIIDDHQRILDLYMGESKPRIARSALNIPVVINAGGKGTRLEPFTKVLPKPLIPVGDLPIIELIMREYQTYSCDDFHIIVNYKRELMKAYFADNESKYRITWYDETRPLGTGGGLSLLRGQLDGTFFFANSDALLTADYGQILRFHQENGNMVTMICAYRNLTIPYGIVEMGVNGKIEGMREKPVMSFLTNTGIYIVEPEVIDDIGDDEEIGFPDIVERERKMGRKVAVYPVSEKDWMDMGQLPELEKMRKRLYGE